MPAILPVQAVVVSADSFDSAERYDIIRSNIDFVNDLFTEAYLRADEVCPDALRSYYADYYLAQVNNGGLSQFVYNSRWNDEVVALVRAGLTALGATHHLVIFDELTTVLSKLDGERLDDFLDGEYFGEDFEADRAALDLLNDRFFDVAREEDLIALNAEWLRGRLGLQVLSVEDMRAELHRIAEAVPDRDERAALARGDEPEYVKVIRALCERAGHELDRVTAGDPAHQHDEQTTLAWHFLTNHGHHYLVTVDGSAHMINADSGERVTELSAALVELIVAAD